LTRDPFLGKEVILDEGGVRVEVEETTKINLQEDDGDDDLGEISERLQVGDGEAWRMPGLGTPSGKMRIAPTARPPTL
jgi:calcipressin-2